MTEPTGRPVGRPSEYDPAYCDDVITDMADGYSLTAFAGKIGVSHQTLVNWTKAYPEFLDAVSRAKAVRLRKWEDMGINVAGKGAGGPGASTVIVFGLKNMGGEEWSTPDKVEHAMNVVINGAGTGGDADL